MARPRVGSAAKVGSLGKKLKSPLKVGFPRVQRFWDTRVLPGKPRFSLLSLRAPQACPSPPSSHQSPQVVQESKSSLTGLARLYREGRGRPCGGRGLTVTGQRANQRSPWRSSAHPSKPTQPRLAALVESQKDLES